MEKEEREISICFAEVFCRFKDRIVCNDDGDCYCNEGRDNGTL